MVIIVFFFFFLKERDNVVWCLCRVERSRYVVLRFVLVKEVNMRKRNEICCMWF